MEGIRLTCFLARVTTLKDVLDQRLLSTHFQPIVELDRGHIIGYEALTRGPEGTMLEAPRALFAEAGRSRLLPQLEESCWTSALESALRQASRRAPASRLFLNAHPSTLLSHDFERSAYSALERLRMDPSQIVIEISEETRVDDYAAFRAAISSYRLAGFGIAIDDAGAGHAGLQMMAEIVPDLIKIDGNLVREVDKHKGRRATVEALLVLARTLAIDVVAEGIERVEELATLRDLGVQLGQGYLLARPAARIPETTGLPALRRPTTVDGASPAPVSAAGSIGRLAASSATVASGVELSAVVQLFESQHVDGVAILDGMSPVGLVMKVHVYQLLGRAYGRELYLRRPVEMVASRRPLIVDHRTPLEEVSRMAMAREAKFLYDHIIVARDGGLAGIVSVQRLLAAITDVRVDAARHANPLTGLPGNALIERELRNRIRHSSRIALMHIDLDDFKAFNDAYGFHRGDVAIGMTAAFLHEELTANAGPHFLGHIGGDDFLAIVDGSLALSVADRLRGGFTKRISTLYEADDRRRGWICAPDRTGENEIFPLMTLSVAMAFVEPNDSRHYAELLDDLSAAKRDTKSRKLRRLLVT